MSDTISQQVIDQVRDHFDLVDVVSGYTTLKQRGKSFVGLCPFHDEKTPSFTVSRERQLYYCFGCGAGGNLFTFIMSKEGLTFPEALRMLAEKAGVEIQKETPAATAFRERKEQLLQLLRQAAIFYYKNLRSPLGKPCRQYLARRGITAKTAEAFGLGFAPPGWDHLYRHLTRHGFDDKLMTAAGVIQEKNQGGYYDRLRDRLIFPIINLQGKVVAFGGRALDQSDSPKYLNSPETELFNKGRLLYGMHIARKAIAAGEPALVMEGYMDVISAHQAGFAGTVASLGTSLTEDQARLLHRFTETVTIVYDADAAGQAATLRGMEILGRTGLIVRVASLPQGKDPDEYLRQFGSESFRREIIDKALLLADYRLKNIRSKYDITTSEGKIRYKKEVLNFLAELEGEVERETYLRQVAAELVVSPQSLQQDLQAIGRKRIRAANIGKNRNISNERKQKSPDAEKRAEQMAVAVLLRRPDLMKRFRPYLSPLFFTQPLLKRVVQLIRENSGVYQPADIIKDSFTIQEQSLLTGLLFREEYNHPDMNEEKSLADCITKMIKIYLHDRETEIRRTIAVLIDNRKDPEKLKNLMEKLTAIEELNKRVKEMVFSGQTLELQSFLELEEEKEFG